MSPETQNVILWIAIGAALFYLAYKALPKLYAQAVASGNDSLAALTAALFMGPFAL